MSYQLIRRKVPVLRTDQWNPRTVEEGCNWIEGPGVNRPATDIEIAIVDECIQRAIKVVQRFDDIVNYKLTSDMPGTPGEALRREFGL